MGFQRPFGFLFAGFCSGGAGVLLALLGACSTAQPPLHDDVVEAMSPEQERAIAQSAWARASSVMPLATEFPDSGTNAERAPTWRHRVFPNKRPNGWAAVQEEGREALWVRSHASTSVWYCKLHLLPEHIGKIRFSWKVPATIAKANLGERENDDAPVRLVLAFDGDRRQLPMSYLLMSDLARVLIGEELPYATLMYVWSNQAPVESVVHSPRTDRIRKIVLESGASHLGQWRDYERQIAADFEKAFGEKPGPLIGVGLMTDTDNTRAQAQAWYGPLHLLP